MAVAAAGLKEGLYRILNSEIDSIGYVAEASYYLPSPVKLSLSRPHNLYELVSFFLCHVLLICDAYMYIVGCEAS